MAPRQGLTKGSRILVKLPFGRTVAPTKTSEGKSQIIKLKQKTAKLLGFKQITTFVAKSVTFKTAKSNVRHLP